jgi:hypothetical protein
VRPSFVPSSTDVGPEARSAALGMGLSDDDKMRYTYSACATRALTAAVGKGSSGNGKMDQLEWRDGADEAKMSLRPALQTSDGETRDGERKGDAQQWSSDAQVQAAVSAGDGEHVRQRGAVGAERGVGGLGGPQTLTQTEAEAAVGAAVGEHLPAWLLTDESTEGESHTKDVLQDRPDLNTEEGWGPPTKSSALNPKP